MNCSPSIGRDCLLQPVHARRSTELLTFSARRQSSYPQSTFYSGNLGIVKTHISPALKSAACRATAMPEQKVEFKNKANEKLVGILLDTGSKDAVILCHGFASHKNGFHCPAIAEALQEKGLSSFRIDLSGNGESEGQFKYANVKEEAADMAAAAEYLENVGKKALGVMGHSKAGSGALLHAADYGSIPRIANVSGRFDHKRGLTRRFGEDVFEVVEKEGGKLVTFKTKGGPSKDMFFDKKDLNDRMTIDMADISSRIPSDIRVITVHGSDDSTIPVKDAQEFAKLLPGNNLVVIEGADHNYTVQEHADQLVNVLADFFTES